METHGAESFNEAVKAGHLVTLPAITSIARTLGAKVSGLRDKEQIVGVFENIPISDRVALMFLRNVL